MDRIPQTDFKRLFESAPGLFLVLAPTSRFTILGASDAYLNATMTVRDEVVGRGIFDVFPDNPADASATGVSNLRASLERVLANKRPDTMAVQKYDIPRPAADGGGFEERYWSPCNIPVSGTDGSLAYIIHRVEDVTDYVRLTQANQRHRAQADDLAARNQEMQAEILRRNRELSTLNAELRETNRALAGLAEEIRQESQRKDEFLAMLAHELRNPLASMRNAAWLLGQRRHDFDDDARRQMAILSRQTDTLSHLLDGLLDVSRITRGSINLKEERVDMAAVVGRAVETTAALLAQRKHDLQVNLPSAPAWVMGDATRLEQVVTNLLTNAAKYTRPGGHIAVSLVQQADKIELRVKDDGVGLAPEMADRVFELFQQAERGLDRAEGGLGVGLTIAKRMVEMHGGHIRAVSEGLDRGSEFIISLPAAPSERPEPVPETAESPAAAHGRRVLVVDDDRDAAESLVMLLEFSGHQVAYAHDGPSALALFQEFAPQVVLLDIGMPQMSGYEVAERLRRHPKGADLRLAAISGYGSARIGSAPMRPASMNIS